MAAIADPSQHSTEILNALDRVVSHDILCRSDRLCGFLRYVVDQTLLGNGDELKEFVIGHEAYRKGSDFDPRLDASVRVDARRLRAKLDAYYAGPGASDPIRIEIPKGTYTPVFVRSESKSSVPGIKAGDTTAAHVVPGRPFATLSVAAAGLFIGILVWASARVMQGSSPPSSQLDGLTKRARHLAARRTPESLQRAINYGEQALRTTPTDPRSHSVLADAYLSLATFDKSNEERLVRKALEIGQRSLDLDPSGTDSTTVLATIEMEKGNWSRAQHLFETALSREPGNCSSHARYARFLSLQGRHAEAIEHANAAVLNDSLNVPAWASLAQAHMYARDYLSALQAMERGLEIDPAFDNGHLLCARLNILLGRFPDAHRHLSAVSAAGQRRPEHAVARAWLLAREGVRAEALKELRSAAGASSIGVATAYAALGQHDEAFRVLRAAIQAGDRDMVYLKVSPGLDTLRSDLRLESLCEQVRLRGCTQTPTQTALAPVL